MDNVFRWPVDFEVLEDWHIAGGGHQERNSEAAGSDSKTFVRPVCMKRRAGVYDNILESLSKKY